MQLLWKKNIANEASLSGCQEIITANGVRKKQQRMFP